MFSTFQYLLYFSKGLKGNYDNIKKLILLEVLNMYTVLHIEQSDFFCKMVENILREKKL